MKITNENNNSGIKEIARLANVAKATVDRVIHNRPGVAKKTKEKIEKIIKELDYQPNIFARRLASRKVLQFATLIPRVSKETDFWSAPLQGIDQAGMEIKQNGIIIKKYFFDLNSRKSFVEQSKMILKTKPDGVLLAPSFVEESTAFIRSCKKLAIPYVLINADIPGQNSLCYIGPDLFHSGYMCAHLINYLVDEGDKILTVNISSSMEQHHELLRKEEGVKSYFEKNKITPNLIKTNIEETSSGSVATALSKVLRTHPDTKLILVPNSRVSTVAKYLEKQKSEHILLIGYDFTQENLHYLDNNIIDFLICEKPKEQGYKGIMTLYQTLVFDFPVENVHFMPIDIISKENYKFYRN